MIFRGEVNFQPSSSFGAGEEEGEEKSEDFRRRFGGRAGGGYGGFGRGYHHGRGAVVGGYDPGLVRTRVHVQVNETIGENAALPFLASGYLRK